MAVGKRSKKSCLSLKICLRFIDDVSLHRRFFTWIIDDVCLHRQSFGWIFDDHSCSGNFNFGVME
ncbi:MAG: hypothetical protein GTO45_38100 [Candidatus Aminicenantes bacterium]|nr:hypothetical protein [Candidatus Aminicenantes bacterium]NIM84438.1 hypothetical protein [Candidatus Aminicenantes bacterium]NIN23958.1 hypothetical protein [Candidatus Aminicenantes bacterium]NIN47672.1 hypothetical protein [Candidatus Aminicenantes bacterium]NIN90602.1 hypothetical protein [Candidatus Aminicenantes bacterium]